MGDLQSTTSIGQAATRRLERVAAGLQIEECLILGWE
jgi:hypothetical protein